MVLIFPRVPIVFTQSSCEYSPRKWKCSVPAFWKWFNFFPSLHVLVPDNCKQSITVAGPRVWNSLPPAIRDPSLSPSIFGKLLKTYLLWTPAQHKGASMLYFANVFYLFIYFFLWPPYSPTLVNGSSRKFHTWWTLSVIREVTTWIFSWSSFDYWVGQKVTKFGVFSDPTRKLSALTPECGRIL